MSFHWKSSLQHRLRMSRNWIVFSPSVAFHSSRIQATVIAMRSSDGSLSLYSLTMWQCKYGRVKPEGPHSLLSGMMLQNPQWLEQELGSILTSETTTKLNLTCAYFIMKLVDVTAGITGKHLRIFLLAWLMIQNQMYKTLGWVINRSSSILTSLSCSESGLVFVCFSYLLLLDILSYLALMFPSYVCLSI